MLDMLYTLSGFTVGMLVGLTGVGGGSLMTPLLVVLFGIDPVTAVGTDLLFAAATKTTGTVLHGFNCNIEWRIVGLLACGSVPLTLLAVLVLSRMVPTGQDARQLLDFALGIVLLITAAFLLSSRALHAKYADRIGTFDPKRTALLTVLLGAGLGFLVTTTSVGAGAIGVTVLLFLFPRLSASRIVGSDIAHAVPLTLAAGMGHWYLGSIDWGVLTPLLVGSVPGVVLGTVLVGRISDIIIRTALAIILLIMGVRLIV